jgi:hypothetical protein
VLYGLFEAKMSSEDVAKATGVDQKIIEEVVQTHQSSAHKRAYPPMIGGE